MRNNSSAIDHSESIGVNLKNWKGSGEDEGEGGGGVSGD